MLFRIELNYKGIRLSPNYGTEYSVTVLTNDIVIKQD